MSGACLAGWRESQGEQGGWGRGSGRLSRLGHRGEGRGDHIGPGRPWKDWLYSQGHREPLEVFEQ